MPAQPVGPSTTADLGQGVTIHISSFSPGTNIGFEIDNRGTNPFVLDFDSSDLTVYDDANHVYPVDYVNNNHVTIEPGSKFTGTYIGVRGTPTSVAKSWTVNFKAISGRQNITIVYTLA